LKFQKKAGLFCEFIVFYSFNRDLIGLFQRFLDAKFILLYFRAMTELVLRSDCYEVEYPSLVKEMLALGRVFDYI
jgi:hypothetical protein